MNDLVQITASDLRFLQEAWDQGVDDHSLRRSSTILRRLLVENELQRAWMAAGFVREPMIHASDLHKVVGATPFARVVFASAGGARFNGMSLQGLIFVNYAKSLGEIRSKLTAGLPESEFGLRAFVESPAVIISGHEIPRRVVVKFIANKMGGAHFDPKRAKSKEEQDFVRLDEAAQQYQLAGKNAVYFELLSIGQALVGAQDIQQFLTKVTGTGSGAQQRQQ